MPGSSFFQALGVFVVENFLTDSECQILLNELRSASAETATVATHGAEYIEEDTRSTKIAELSDITVAQYRDRMRSLISAINGHYHTSLTDCQVPQFLAYYEGDFFSAHSDKSDEEDAAKYVKQRTITAVVFLNRQSDQPQANHFGGGELALYGLMDGEKWGEAGFPLDPTPGLLVAFHSDIIHEVKPVTHGERYTVVTWYY